MRWYVVMPKPDGHHRAVAKFKSRSEKSQSKTERMDCVPCGHNENHELVASFEEATQSRGMDRVVPGNTALNT